MISITVAGLKKLLALEPRLDESFILNVLNLCLKHQLTQIMIRNKKIHRPTLIAGLRLFSKFYLKTFFYETFNNVQT